MTVNEYCSATANPPAGGEDGLICCNCQLLLVICRAAPSAVSIPAPDYKIRDVYRIDTGL